MHLPFDDRTNNEAVVRLERKKVGTGRVIYMMRKKGHAHGRKRMQCHMTSDRPLIWTDDCGNKEAENE